MFDWTNIKPSNDKNKLSYRCLFKKIEVINKRLDRLIEDGFLKRDNQNENLIHFV